MPKFIESTVPCVRKINTGGPESQISIWQFRNVSYNFWLYFEIFNGQKSIEVSKVKALDRTFALENQ